MRELVIPAAVIPEATAKKIIPSAPEKGPRPLLAPVTNPVTDTILPAPTRKPVSAVTPAASRTKPVPSPHATVPTSTTAGSMTTKPPPVKIVTPLRNERRVSFEDDTPPPPDNTQERMQAFERDNDHFHKLVRTLKDSTESFAGAILDMTVQVHLAHSKSLKHQLRVQAAAARIEELLDRAEACLGDLDSTSP